MSDDHPLATRASVAFAETLDGDHVGLHAASSINARTHLAARQAGKSLRLRIHVPGFDAVCRMVQAGMGVGVLPHKVYQLMGRPLGLVGTPLEVDWSERSLVLVVRDVEALSPVSRLLFDHLRSVEALEATAATATTAAAEVPASPEASPAVVKS